MTKPNKNRERREMVEQMRRQAKAQERRRTMVVVAICTVVALIIVGVGAYSVIRDKQKDDKLKATDLTELGSAATKAGCTQVKEVDATGAGQHTTAPVTYTTVPPAFGEHNPTADSSGSHFYTADDRPEVEVLVHNLEHGWTIVWYDDTIADDDDAMDALKTTADKFDTHGQDPRYNMIIAPWTSSDQDGGVIPDGKHLAITHWSIHQPTFDPAVFSKGTPPSWGQSQYCTTFSGAVLDDFMKKYPFDDAPEGFLWHQQQ